MQHWYLEKSQENAEKVKKYFAELQKILKIYGIKKEIDAQTATRLANGWHSQETHHNLYQELFGMDLDHNRKEILNEWELLVRIGKLLEFFYKEKRKIEKALNTDEIGTKLREDLKNLNGSIGEKIEALQSEIVEKFEEVKSRNKKLTKILMELTKLFEDMSKRMKEGHKEMKQLNGSNNEGLFIHSHSILYYFGLIPWTILVLF